MKGLISLFFLLIVLSCSAQTEADKLTTVVKEFHQSLVKKDIVSIDRQTDMALSYGHSNGWVQTKADIAKDFETGFISYQSFKEDSITISVNGAMANVRFLADVSATVKGATSHNHWKVLEVWVKRDNGWSMFARQAVKIQ